MKNKKLLSRLLCFVLSVLMVVCVVPALAVSADDETGGTSSTTKISDYTRVEYADQNARLAAMTKFYDDGKYALYCDEYLGVVAYEKVATGEVLFTNPWDMTKETTGDTTSRNEIMSQILLKYVDAEGNEKPLNSFNDAALKGQISVKNIKNGIRVEYAIGEISARILLPRMISYESFMTNIYEPMNEQDPAAAKMVRQWYSTKATYDEKLDISYITTDTKITTKKMRQLEAYILAYCPQYSFEKMDEDYEAVGYEDNATAAPVFRMALEYTIDASGLMVTLPANGMRYDESVYRISSFSILPYMGASYKKNEGYSFYPDGSGAIFSLSTETGGVASRVYGDDFALFKNISGLRTDIIRMPVFGQVETDATSGSTRGFFAIIEEGDSLATINLNHSKKQYASVYPSFITRQSDTASKSTSSTVYAYRRYVEDYKIRYIILSDDTKAQTASLSSYYECSWMGMACAYRDYLDASSESFNRLTSDEVESSIPLYIETFGCVDTIKKIASVPVTVSVALTSFDDISEMYSFLSGKGVTNVNFKLSGYANGGLYSEVPYKLKWQSSVGGKSGFKDLLEEAQEKGFGIFPDFDFVYANGENMGGAVRLKKNASRTVDNVYTTKRVYMVSAQGTGSFYQVVLSPATYSKFYEKIAKKYNKYKNANGISLSTFGSDLNSDFDEDKTVLREESKEYVITALQYFTKDGRDIMVDSGNAYTWSYVDHIVNVPLDSSRYKNELNMVPFMGVVLHGYVEFAGSALNMEGNLTYAMLKAMENGAGIYFVLSYDNTELLKEDVQLSQNYSVRYDIWQNRLVEIYKEINEVLADVQTKLIIDHQFLTASRIPDAEELADDIAEENAKKTAEIEAQAERENAAETVIAQSLAKISNNQKMIAANLALMKTQLESYTGTPSAMNSAWVSFANDLEDQTKQLAFTNALFKYLVEPYTGSLLAKKDADTCLKAAKENYDYLVKANAAADVLANAKSKLEAIIDAYAQVQSAYYGVTYTVNAAAREQYISGEITNIKLVVTTTETAVTMEEADAYYYLFANEASINTKYQNAGVDAIVAAYKFRMVEDNMYADADARSGGTIGFNNVFDFQEMCKMYEEKTVINTADDTSDTTGTTTTVTTAVKSKYAIDNSVVLVTYGEKDAPYKSLILNFNDYAIRTEFNGVVYTIDAYAYAVIYH